MNNNPGNRSGQVHVLADIPEKFTQLSDALEIFFDNSPVSSYPFGKTMVSQLRFCIRQSCNLVKSQERLLEELEETQKALNQKDEALERMTELYLKGQAAMSRMKRASYVQDMTPKMRPGRQEERLTHEQRESDSAVSAWI
ncbi:unnamed protein product [Fusarium fujikuroi]|nr:unnamed protein product [Fusarium fujikuroi]